MNLNKLNEIMKKRLNEGFFGKIQEGDSSLKPKIVELLKTCTIENFELAINVASGLEIDIDNLLEEVYDLNFWEMYYGVDYTRNPGLHSMPKVDRARRFITTNYLSITTPVDEGIISNAIELPLPNLKTIYFTKCDLTSMPNGTFVKPNLTELKLSYNAITSLPEMGWNLPNLVTLDLSGNRLQEVPKQIETLTNLEFLFLEANKLTEIPDWIFNLKKLQVLTFGRNSLGKKLEDEIAKKCHARGIHFDFFNLT